MINPSTLAGEGHILILRVGTASRRRGGFTKTAPR